MNYKIILGGLIALAVLLVVAIIVSLFKRGSEPEEEVIEKRSAKKSQNPQAKNQAQPQKKTNAHSKNQAQKQASRRRPQQEADGHTRPITIMREDSGRKKKRRQWKLVLKNTDTWDKYDFIFYDNIGLGRNKNTEEFEKYLVVRDDPKVSKVHCAIIHSAGKLYLKDMGSRNGTYLNGVLLEKPILLQKDDVIGLGETQIEIVKVLRERE